MLRTRARPAQRANGVSADGFTPHKLTGLLVAPRWLRELGRSAWLAVGITLFVVGVVWLLSLTQTIVEPVITAGVVAAVASPLLALMERHGIRRGIGAALLLVVAIILGLGVVLMILAGIRSQSDALGAQLSAAQETLTGWLADLGVDPGTADAARKDVSGALADAVPALLGGVADGIKQLSSLVFFLALTVLSLFFLLMDGPLIRHWAEGHMRVPRPVAHRIGQRVLE